MAHHPGPCYPSGGSGRSRKRDSTPAQEAWTEVAQDWFMFPAPVTHVCAEEVEITLVPRPPDLTERLPVSRSRVPMSGRQQL